MMMPFKISISDIIAMGALLLSAYAIWMTSRFNQKQNKVNERQHDLNKLLLEKENSEILNTKKADLSAMLIDHGGWRLKIWNKGRALARGVTLEFPDGNDFLIQSDIDSKFPLELDTQQSVELTACIYLDSKSKRPIKFIWSDEFSDDNEKVIFLTS